MQKIRQIIMSRWFWLLTAVLLVISRLATWVFPFDSDHWIFYYIGRRWFSDGVLYVDMWDHKSPLIYLYNGLLYKTFGDNLIAHRIIFSLITILAIWVFYKTAILLYKTIKINNHIFIARVSTLVFVFMANLSQFTNSGNNNENLGILFLLLTLYFYLLYRNNRSRQAILLVSGLFAGVVFLLKANFAILLLPIAADLIFITYKNIYRLIGGVAIFAFGTLAQLLVWALYFYYQGTFKQFYIATLQFNSKYIRALGWDLSAPGIKIFIAISLLLLAFFAPFLVKAIKEFWRPNKNSLLIPLLAVAILLSFVAAGTFYSHYFLITTPYLCLIFGSTASRVFAKHHSLKIATLLIIALLLLAISYKQLYNNFYGSAKSELDNQKQAAQYIDKHSKKNDKIFANLYGATFYELAHRDSGSRYISASHPLIDYKYHLGYGFNTKFIVDIEESGAKYVIVSSNKNDLYRVQNPVLMRYFSHNYHPEAAVGGYDILRRN